LYESISEMISIGLAGPLRRRAIRRLEKYRSDWILDSGPGPGTSSRMMVGDGFQKISGLDPSATLLKYAKVALGPSFYPVVGVAENLPFRSNAFSGVLTCFSFRDVRDKPLSMKEFARATKPEGRLEIVDIGKPDNNGRQKLIEVYITVLMPIVARFFIRGRIRGNPFRMIVPTFRQLAKNRGVTELARQTFGSARLTEFLLGGLVIIEAERPDPKR
jgi:demethylmenaquinone methyltransferase / 2-methoxy-6-polyprenyl-1,4-benzoquinol methylase